MTTRSSDANSDVRSHRPVVKTGRVVLFLAMLIIWTWKLLEPQANPAELHEKLGIDLTFVLQKCLHAFSYAVLAAVSATIATSPGGRWLMLGFLALHGVGTEIAQYLLPFNRHGCIQDVLIDWVGLMAGYMTIRFWQDSAAAMVARPGQE